MRYPGRGAAPLEKFLETMRAGAAVRRFARDEGKLGHVIMGAGAAGALADRLTASGRARVLLMEAGQWTQFGIGSTRWLDLGGLW